MPNPTIQDVLLHLVVQHHGLCEAVENQLDGTPNNPPKDLCTPQLVTELVDMLTSLRPAILTACRLTETVLPASRDDLLQCHYSTGVPLYTKEPSTGYIRLNSPGDLSPTTNRER